MLRLYCRRLTIRLNYCSVEYTYKIRNIKLTFMIAVIKTGGKQYSIQENTIVRIEKILAEAGSTVKFEEVILLSSEDGKTFKVGSPIIEGMVVTGTVLKQGRARKVGVVKYKNKTRYKRTAGHRQYFTDVKIEKIG